MLIELQPQLSEAHCNLSGSSKATGTRPSPPLCKKPLIVP